MSTWFAVAWVPVRLALIPCAIYLGITVALWACFAVATRLAGWGVLIVVNRAPWAALNTVIFLLASLLAWRVFPLSR